jgi:hypothetical protein
MFLWFHGVLSPIVSIVTKLITHGNFSPSYILKMFHCEIAFKCIQYVTTLTSSSRLIVECKGTWGQKNVLDNETHFHLMSSSRLIVECKGIWGQKNVLDSETHFHLTSSSRLIVKCKGTWGQKNVLDSETHFHKWGKVQEIELNDSQMRSHFGGCIRAKVQNIQNFSWREQKNTNLGPQSTIGNDLNYKYLKCPHIVHLNLKCMSYDQKKNRKSNWEFDSWPQILLKARVKLTPIKVCNTPLKRSFWRL